MDSTLQGLLTAMAEAGRRPVDEGTPQQARAQLAGRERPVGRALHRIQDESVPVEGGTVAVRVYQPGPEPSGVVVYLHGGGWVIGSVDAFDTVARELAHWSGARVVSVNYSLAPENPYPRALRETVGVLEWVGGRFPGQPLAVAGDSAGGNLATVAARIARERGTTAPVVQLLYYPVTDYDMTRESYRADPPVPTLLSAREMEWFWGHYVPDPAARTDPCVAPLRAESFAGTAPVVLILAGYDPLRDEGLAYARALDADGVPVELTVFDDMCHGFIGLAGLLDEAEEALRLGGAAVAKHFGTHTAR